MSNSSTTASYPAAIEFDCQSCASTLEVPFSYLGASGPCPYCDGTATAPSLAEWEAHHPRSSQPQGEASADGEMRAPRRKRRPKAASLAEAAPPVPSPETERMLNPDPRSQQRVEGRMASIKEKFLRARMPRMDDSGPSLPQILGWSTVALALVATGFGLAVAFYTVPLKASPHQYDMPVNLTEQVIMQKARQEKLRAQAMSDAQDAVSQFLYSGSSEGGKLSMLSHQERPKSLSGNIFPDLKREDLFASTCIRLPGSEDYLVTVEPANEQGPIFIVQQDQGKLMLHADALTQQAGDTVNAFLNATGDASLVAYVLASPSLQQAQIEGLNAWPKMAVCPAFPCSQQRSFVACAQPDSSAAESLATRAGTTHFNKTVAEFKWSKTTQGKRFIELVRIIPNAWAKF
jgi:hypothetical protein